MMSFMATPESVDHVVLRNGRQIPAPPECWSGANVSFRTEARSKCESGMRSPSVDCSLPLPHAFCVLPRRAAAISASASLGSASNPPETHHRPKHCDPSQPPFHHPHGDFSNERADCRVCRREDFCARRHAGFVALQLESVRTTRFVELYGRRDVVADRFHPDRCHQRVLRQTRRALHLLACCGADLVCLRVRVLRYCSGASRLVGWCQCRTRRAGHAEGIRRDIRSRYVVDRRIDYSVLGRAIDRCTHLPCDPQTHGRKQGLAARNGFDVGLAIRR